MPIKSHAIDRAEQEARKLVEVIKLELAAAGNDINKAAPRPEAWGAVRGHYQQAKAKRSLVDSLTKRRPPASGGTYYSPLEAEIVDVDDKLVERFVARVKVSAGHEYDAFVAKLVHKVGAGVESATLAGSHVWGYSTLTVNKVGGEVQRWRTQQIVNVSKLGTLFNQFPTRKVK